MKKTIMLVEDEPRIRKLISDYLLREGFNILEASNGKEALDIFNTMNLDLIILDVMMPILDGFSVCKEIRKISTVPIIILTAKAEEEDELLGYDIGSDDYVTKPFSPRELVLRVQIILRRGSQVTIQGIEPASGMIEFLDLKIDPTKRRVFVGRYEIELTMKEFDVLYLMAKHPKQVFSRSQLLERIWGFEYEGCTNTVTVLMSRLREKLEKHATKNRWIHTVWGIGYCFESDGGNDK